MYNPLLLLCFWKESTQKPTSKPCAYWFNSFMCGTPNEADRPATFRASKYGKWGFRLTTWFAAKLSPDWILVDGVIKEQDVETEDSHQQRMERRHCPEVKTKTHTHIHSCDHLLPSWHMSEIFPSVEECIFIFIHEKCHWSCFVVKQWILSTHYGSTDSLSGLHTDSDQLD